MFFKKKLNCNHEWKNIGMYYKTHLTQYRNCFDEVIVYNRCICSKCGDMYNKEMSIESFLPEMYHRCDTKKEEYITKLKSKGIFDEIDFITNR